MQWLPTHAQRRLTGDTNSSTTQTVVNDDQTIQESQIKRYQDN